MAQNEQTLVTPTLAEIGRLAGWPLCPLNWDLWLHIYDERHNALTRNFRAEFGTDSLEVVCANVSRRSELPITYQATVPKELVPPEGLPVCRWGRLNTQKPLSRRGVADLIDAPVSQTRAMSLSVCYEDGDFMPMATLWAATDAGARTAFAVLWRYYNRLWQFDFELRQEVNWIGVKRDTTSWLKLGRAPIE